MYLSILIHTYLPLRLNIMPLRNFRKYSAVIVHEFFYVLVNKISELKLALCETDHLSYVLI